MCNIFKLNYFIKLHLLLLVKSLKIAASKMGLETNEKQNKISTIKETKAVIYRI